jgi:hypothetical protein
VGASETNLLDRPYRLPTERKERPMQGMRIRFRSGSGADTERPTSVAPTWEREWRAAVAEGSEATHERARRRLRGVWVAAAALVAALLPAILPLTPGFSAADTVAAVAAASLTSVVAVGVVPMATYLLRWTQDDALVLTVALLSAGAAAIHFAVVKMHFDEYTLFGIFFVGAGVAQLAWGLWLVVRPSRPLLVLGALGNALIVALWGVDRIWGLPLGPEHWKPEPVGFGDGVTAAFELLLVTGCIAVLGRGGRRPMRTRAAVALTLAVAALTALSLLSVLAVGSSFLTPTE